MDHQPSPPASPPSGSLAGHPLRYLARHKWWVAGGGLCLVGTNAMAQSIPWVVKRAVETIERAGSFWEVGQLTLIIAGLALAQALIRIPSRILIFNAAREAEYELRGLLFTRLCQAESAFFRHFRSGDLMSRLTSDLSAVRALFGPGVLHVVNTVFAYAVALPLMLSIDPWLTLFALLPYPVLLLGARRFARGIYNRSQKMQASMSTMTATVQEDLAGIREVRLHRMEGVRSAAFSDASRHYLRQAIRLASWRAGLIPFVGIGSGASLVIVLWLGGTKVIDGQLSLGDLVAINLYVGMLAWPTMSIGWILSMWQRGVASWHRLAELFEHRQGAALEVDLGATAAADAEPGAPPPSLEVRRLTVELDRRRVLDDVSFTVPAGALCGVVGRVGSGKTTLVEAIARLLDIPAGTILLDGQDVTGLAVDQVRRRIAYAPQNAFLFSATIRHNIAYGLPADAPLSSAEVEARIAQAVRISGLEPDLQSLPDGLDTMVGERGLSLSGGQRQRIALARALVAHRPVLLLDDSLSSVDADTERQILEGLSGALKDRTVLLVSHRLSALQHADQVVVLDEGHVAEAGTHAELLGRDHSLYAKLYHRQLLLQQLEEGP